MSSVKRIWALLICNTFHISSTCTVDVIKGRIPSLAKPLPIDLLWRDGARNSFIYIPLGENLVNSRWPYIYMFERAHPIVDYKLFLKPTNSRVKEDMV